MYDFRHAQGSILLPQSGAGKDKKVRYTNRWDINPQSTEIRLIVLDRFTGAYGSIDLPVKQIPLATTAKPTQP